VLAHHYWPGSALWDPTGGRIGVDFFFVLSGFLITRSLVRDRAEAPGNPWPRLLRFYVRRVRRIIPLFYTTLALGALLRWDRIRVSLPWHLSFLSNVYFIREGRFVGSSGQLWFVAVEQHFYLFWPLAILFLPRRWMRAAPLFLIGIGILARVIAGWKGWAPITVDLMTPGAFEALGLGACLPWFLENRAEESARNARCLTALGLTGLILCGLTAVVTTGEIGRWVMLLGTELGRSLVLLWLIAQAVLGLPGWIGSALESSPAQALGRWSFAIFLCHNMAKEEVAAFYGDRLPLTQPYIALAVTLIWSAVAYHVIEKPTSERRHTWRPDSERSAV
jgi:peptidoglycan/LPS O-acetylase OafA/YrhL